MNRLILVDNAMANFFSHYFNANYGIVKAAQERGIQTRVISRNIFDDDIQKLLLPEEILEVPMGFSHNGFFNIDYCATYASRLVDNFEAFGRTVRYGDMIVFMTIGLTELLAIARWVLSVPVRFGVHFCLVFTEKLDSMSPDEGFFPEVLNIVQHCLGALQTRPDVSFSTPLEAVSHQVRKYTTKEVDLTGSFLSMQDSVKDRREGDPVVFGHLGVTSLNKGFDIVYRSVRNILNLDPFIKILLQVNLNHLDEDLGPFPAQDDPRVVVYTNTLSQEAYLAAFREIDVFLMPYNSARYGTTTSGVFSEAMSAGKLVVVSDDTRMAVELTEFGECGVRIPPTDAGLVDGCQEILSKFDSYLSRGEIARRNWHLVNGPGLFIERLQAYFRQSLDPQILMSSRG